VTVFSLWLFISLNFVVVFVVGAVVGAVVVAVVVISESWEGATYDPRDASFPRRIIS
jgi:hypothetical protein